MPAGDFFPQLSAGLDDPRVECLFVDGIRHIQETKGAYDVIIIDSTEPVGPAVGLFSREFYAACFESLGERGVLVAQTESPFFNRDILSRAFHGIKSVFPVCRLYLASIPTYPSGLWSFSLGSKDVDPLDARPILKASRPVITAKPCIGRPFSCPVSYRKSSKAARKGMIEIGGDLGGSRRVLRGNAPHFLGSLADVDEASLMLMGAPFDGTTSFVPGTRFGSGPHSGGFRGSRDV